MSKKNLNRICGRFRKKLRMLLLQAGVARVLVLALLLLPLLLVVDWWVHLGTPWRLLALVGFLAALGGTAWWTLIEPLSRPWTKEQILTHIDTVAHLGTEDPHRRGMLLDLYELLHGDEVQEMETETGRALADAAVQDITPVLQEIKVARSFYHREVVKWMGSAAVVILLFAGAAVPLHTYLGIGCARLFNPFTGLRWPHRTTITFDQLEKGWLVPQLEPFSFAATVEGEIPPFVSLSYRGDETRRRSTQKLEVVRAMKAQDGSLFDPDKVPDKYKGEVVEVGRVQHNFPQVRERYELYLKGGDYTTDTMLLDIVQRPYVKHIEAHYTYPTYAQLPDRTIESGQLVGLEGTKVTLSVTCSMGVDKAVLRLTEGEKKTLPPRPMTATSDDRITYQDTLILKKSGSYTIEIEKSGFREPKPERYEVVVTPDHMPKVQMLSPARDLEATNQASINIAFRATDDFGLSKVQFLYRVGDGAPQVLSDRITGPIPQAGKVSEARFTWDLRKMKGKLPDSGDISYFARVVDCNPTPGRPSVDSASFKIKLLSRPEFQRVLVERAKRLLNEARIAWGNQYDAYSFGAAWLKKGTGKQDDKLWLEMEDRQDVAMRAGTAMQMHMQSLVTQFTRNRMGRELMDRRLSVISKLIVRLAEQEHPAVKSGLRAAEPKIDADALEHRLKKLRTDALSKFINNQKMAVLVLQRALRKLYDWRDLQTTSITATLLHVNQTDVIAITEEIAPRYIGKDILDLTDKEQEDLLTLGKRQRTIYDTETELERQLSEMVEGARLEKRESIQAPLQAAFKQLRDRRVNDDLKRAAKMIEQNMPYQIVKNQKRALFALDLVRGGLIMAGQKVDPDPELTLAMKVIPKDIMDPEKKERPPTPPGPGPEPEPEPEPVTPVKAQDLIRYLRELKEPLSSAIRLTVELQDNVLARTKFLDDNLVPEDMPRFRRLTQGILGERQGLALSALQEAKRAADKMKALVVKDLLGLSDGEFNQSKALIGVMNYSKLTQGIQYDSIAMLKDLLGLYIPMKKAVSDVVKDNKSRKGLNPFGQEYILSDKNLDTAAEMIRDADHARVAQRDVIRKLRRFAKLKPKDKMLSGFEAANRQKAAALQAEVASRVKALAAKLDTISQTAKYAHKDKDGKVIRETEWDVRPEVEKAGVKPVVALKLGDRAGAVKAGKADETLAGELEPVSIAFGSAVDGLKDLMGAHVKPKVEETVATTTVVVKISQKEYEALHSREAITAALERNEGLQDGFRAIMVKSLSKPLPDKYQALLKEYYASFGKRKEKEEAGD